MPAHPPAIAFVTDPNDLLHALEPVRTQRMSTQDPVLDYNAGQIFQEIEGYGGALTDSAVLAINSLKGGVRRALLEKLFDPVHGLNVNYLRVPIGSTDFSESTYSYEDLPDGEEDPGLTRFSMQRAEPTLQLLHEIIKINPNVKLLLSPWSPPAWMKTNDKLEGGNLQPKHFATLARYLIKTLDRFESEGLPVAMMTVQNEPYFANDKYPSMSLEADDQIHFIRDYFSPLLRASEYGVGILGLDHNYDLRSEADRIYDGLKGDLAGIAYHCYGGNYNQMVGSTAALYQTECTGTAGNTDDGTMDFWLGGQVLGAGLVGAKLTMAWNIALDKSHGPTIGYCDNCRGLADVDADAQTFTLNTELLAMAQAGKYWRPGARRIATGVPGDGYTYAGYLNQDGEIILVVDNSSDAPRGFLFRDRTRVLNRVEVPAHGGVTVLLPP